MLRLDLSDAKIDPVDAEGRIVDFHAQRTTFITDLARAGVSPATAQKLARHSDINLTLGTYTCLEAQDLMTALQKLPALSLTGTRTPNSEQPTGNSDETRPDIDPRLGGVVSAWPELTEHIRQAILALVATSAKSGK